jgi:hypothetical protein
MWLLMIDVWYTRCMGGSIMSTAEQDIAAFTNFALQRIESGDRDPTIDELFDQWRIENPTNYEYAENVAAVRASIADFRAGERGTIADEHLAQLRRLTPISFRPGNGNLT